MQSVLHESESAFEQMELYIAMISFVPKCHYRRIIEIIIESLFVPNLEINQNFTLGTSSVPIIDQDPCNAIRARKNFLFPRSNVADSYNGHDVHPRSKVSGESCLGCLAN